MRNVILNNDFFNHSKVEQMLILQELKTLVNDYETYSDDFVEVEINGDLAHIEVNINNSTVYLVHVIKVYKY